MTHVTSNPPDGTPTWIDLGIPDLERAKTFYGTLFGWRFHDTGAESGHYTMCLLGGEMVAALMRNPEDNASEFWWNVYLAADDCDAAVKRITDAGGGVVVPPMDVMTQGRMAMVRDAQGAQFGLWQGRDHTGSRIVNEPGSFVWNEVVTPDPSAARDFYTTVWDFEAEEAPGDTEYYALKRSDGRYIGGIAGVPGPAAPSWVTYFEVTDPDEAVRRVRAGGGTVEEDPRDTPYGRIAYVRDPFGTPFMLMKPAPAPD
ncbi:VOC family protein [Spirillospora albida]|uniref:VOC family protein n=1 Tax=Spirillospora albida TaxID=58123 RepID=UPI0004BF3445|nr:VOC family protein [Spirillospora albida]